jgi:GH25 family lysozyme M1 (1,4-beta-N-acetylmuramidase)
MNGWELGTDGSHWMGFANFAKMYNAGARYYIGKASDSYRGGSGFFEDRRFTEHFDRAFGLGQLLLGCFHWLQPDISPSDAADFYLDRYGRYPFHFPPVLDFEEVYAYRDKQGNPTGLESHYAWCAQVWLERVEAHTGRKPLVYSAKWFTDNFERKHLDFLKAYPLWVAQYPYWMTPITRPSLPYPWENWLFWQWSADGNGRGNEFGVQAKSIDLNYWQGDYRQLLDWLDTEKPTPVEPPQGDVMYVIEMLGNLTIREGPGMQFDETGEFARTGETYESREEKNGWYNIGKGWISGLTNWTRITEVEDTEPPVGETIEERVGVLEREVNALDERVTILEED